MEIIPPSGAKARGVGGGGKRGCSGWGKTTRENSVSTYFLIFPASKIVDRKHLIRFESRNIVLIFRSVDEALNFAVLQKTLVIKD